MTDKHKMVTAAGLVLGAALAAYFYYSWETGQRALEPSPELAALELEPETPAATSGVMVDLFIFAPAAGKPGSSPLEKVTRELPQAENPTLQAREIVNAVIRESRAVLPATARVRQTYLLEDGTAVVDLSREVGEQLNGGAGSELAVLRSFTRSLRENVSQVQRVRFLVEGEQRPTLSGHVSIQNPFM